MSMAAAGRHKDWWAVAPWFCFLIVLMPGNASGQPDPPRQEAQSLSGIEREEAAMLVQSQDAELRQELVARLAWRARNLREKTWRGVKDRLPVLEPAPLAAWFADHPLAAVVVRGQLLSARPDPSIDPDAEPPFWRLQLRGEGEAILSAIVTMVPRPLQTAGLPQAEVQLRGFAMAALPAKEAEGEPASSGESVGAGDGAEPPGAEAELAGLVLGQRLEWYPEQPDPALGVTAPLQQLAAAGFDLGHLDAIRDSRFGPLRTGERTAFDAFVAAVARIEEAGWMGLEQSRGNASLLAVFRDPQHATGAPVRMVGTVRRVTDLANGLTQLDLFVDSGLRNGLKITNQAGETVRFGRRLPITVNCPTAVIGPKGPEWDGQQVEVEGLVYRFWTYQSGFAEEQGAGQGQTLPLVIAHRIRKVEWQAGAMEQLLGGSVWLVLGAAAVVLGAITWLNRRDGKRPARARSTPPPSLP